MSFFSLISFILFCYGIAKGDKMLEYLRNAAEKPVAKILIGILAFSFVGWGVAEWLFGNVMTDTTLVSVGDGAVTLQQFNLERSRELALMDKDEQRAVYTDAAAAERLNDKVLVTLTTQQMVQNRANDLGFVVTDARVAREIREFPEFQQDGNFSTLLFDTTLMNSGYTEADFANVLRNQVLRSMVLGAMSAPITVPEFAVNAAYNARYAMRDVDYATVRYDDFQVATPTEKQLRTYYAQNPQIVPEQRTVSYVLIEGDLSKPDEYDAAFATAQKVEDDIIAGETMETSAKNHEAKYIKLQPFALGKNPDDKILTDKIVANIFEMEQELESELIETDQGFIILRVDEIAPAHNADFVSVKDGLTAEWQLAEQKKQAYVRANEILVDLKSDGVFGGDKKSATVSRTDGAPDDVLVAAFNSPIGSQAIVPGKNVFYVLQVNKEIAPEKDNQKLSDLRTELQTISEKSLQDDYNSFLIREYPVKINHNVYDRFIAK